MTVTATTTSARIFPIADQFPLMSKWNSDAEEQTEPRSAVSRPFGLRFATTVKDRIELDLSEVGYDDERQIGFVRQGSACIPLAHTALGRTTTVTGPVGRPSYDEILD